LGERVLQNTGAGHAVLARNMESVRTGSCKHPTIQARGGQAKWHTPELSFPEIFLADP